MSAAAWGNLGMPRLTAWGAVGGSDLDLSEFVVGGGEADLESRARRQPACRPRSQSHSHDRRWPTTADRHPAARATLMAPDEAPHAKASRRGPLSLLPACRYGGFVTVHGGSAGPMWFLESGPAHGLLAVLADAPVHRWTLDELFDRQGWGVVHDSAQPTGYLAVDAGWGFDDAYGLLLYLDDSVLTMLTAVLGHHGDDERRMPLARVLWTVSQRYGRLAQVDGGYAWDTGNGRLLIAPESGVITAVWATRRVLADPAGLRTVGLSMRVLEQMVTSAAGGPGGPTRSPLPPRWFRTTPDTIGGN